MWCEPHERTPLGDLWGRCIPGHSPPPNTRSSLLGLLDILTHELSADLLLVGSRLTALHSPALEAELRPTRAGHLVADP